MPSLAAAILSTDRNGAELRLCHINVKLKELERSDVAVARNTRES